MCYIFLLLNFLEFFGLVANSTGFFYCYKGSICLSGYFSMMTLDKSLSEGLDKRITSCYIVVKQKVSILKRLVYAKHFKIFKNKICFKYSGVKMGNM